MERNEDAVFRESRLLYINCTLVYCFHLCSVISVANIFYTVDCVIVSYDAWRNRTGSLLSLFYLVSKTYRFQVTFVWFRFELPVQLCRFVSHKCARHVSRFCNQSEVCFVCKTSRL